MNLEFIGDENQMEIAAIFISVLALGFTMYSFWWMNWRRGDILIGDPRTFAACSSGALFIMEFPLVFYNAGPRPILIENLRLIFPHEGESSEPLFFNAVVKKLGKDEGREFATQFPLDGNTAIRKICEFQRRPANFVFEAREYKVELQASLNDRKEWETLKTFSLNIRPESVETLNSNTFITHENWIH